MSWFESRWLSAGLIVLAVGLSWLLWGKELIANRPVTRELTPAERRYGPNCDAAVVAALQRRLSINFRAQGHLVEVLELIRAELQPQNVVINLRAMEIVGISRDTPLRADIDGMSIEDAILHVLAAADGGTNKLGLAIDEHAVLIDLTENLPNRESTRVYNVQKLVGSGPFADGIARLSAETQLIQDLTKQIDPSSWRVDGKRPNIQPLPGALIVTQTPVNHHDIAMYLEARRWNSALLKFASRSIPVIAVALTLVGFHSLAVRWHRRRSITRGLCPVCRYDLRASAEQCPECGTEIKIDFEKQLPAVTTD